MKISNKLILAFGVLMLGMIINALMINYTVEKNKEITEKFLNTYQPSAENLQKLFNMTGESDVLIKNWVNEIPQGTPKKVKLENLHTKDYPELIKTMKPIIERWEAKDTLFFKEIQLMIDTLFVMHNEVQQGLVSMEDYNDPMNAFMFAGQVDTGGDITVYYENVQEKLSKLLENFNKIVAKSNADMKKSFEDLRFLIFSMTLILAIALLIIAFFTIRSIVKPMTFITKVTREMGKGILPEETLVEKKDEVGTMAKALNALVDSFKKTSEFAGEVGRGNFQSEFKPLSEQDILGNSLISMRQSLHQAKNEDEKRSWASNGLVKFGSIIDDSTDEKKFGQTVIQFFIEYLNANQGRIFVYNDEDLKNTHLENLAKVPANNNQAEINKNFFGEDILKSTIKKHKTEYFRITSDDNNAQKQAGSVLIVPLTVEDEYIGVVEISSLRHLEENEIEFVERACERVASSLLLIVTGKKREKLLSQLQEANALLKENEELLEQKVIERTAEVVEAMEIIEEKNKHITGSINYAKRIQEAMLPQNDKIAEQLPESFVLFKPRDIVSGDFYWYAKQDGKIIITAVDCTGHGVPGAFVSMVGNSYLNQIVKANGITDADEILNRLHFNVRKALKQDVEGTKNNDGMDMALCVIDKENKTVEFAGAKNPLIYLQNEELTLIKSDKHPIGGQQREDERRFTKHIIDVSQPTTFYLFSDGYQDQVGGRAGRKYMTKRFRKLLQHLHTKPMSVQKDKLDVELQEWMSTGKDHEQIDDILVIGFKI